MTTNEALNPKPLEIKARNRLWAEALIKNRKKANGEMKDEYTGGRCCLRVAEDLMLKLLPEIKDDYVRGSGEPNWQVKHFFGWDKENPTLKLPGGGNESAAALNDSQWYRGKEEGLSHKAIAECVLNTFVHPSKKKWSLVTKKSLAEPEDDTLNLL